MRVVSYARVSTKSQSDRGSSLADQENRFSEWAKLHPEHDRVRAYAEAMSGGKNMRERTFKGMIDDLPFLKVDAIVVDSLDRFTRDKFWGSFMTQTLWNMGVTLWELDYSESEPFSETNKEHRRHISKKFDDAEAERDRIQSRQIKRYAEQRRRGAATTNRPAFGVRLDGDRKGHRRLVPDPDTAPIVQEVDRRILAGQSQRKVLEWLRGIRGAWQSRRGLVLALQDEANSYVDAGVRTQKTQDDLRRLLGSRRQAYGEDRSTRSLRVHPLAGLVACELCVRAGIAPEHALMHGRYVARNRNQANLVCEGKRQGGVSHQREFYVSAYMVLALIAEKLERLRDPDVARAVLAKWAKEPKADRTTKLRQSLERKLDELKEKEVELDTTVDAAMSLLTKRGPMAAEAERRIERAGVQRLSLDADRAAVNRKLSQLPVARPDAETTFETLQLQAASFPLMPGECWPESPEVEARLNEHGVLEFFNVITPNIRDALAPWVIAIGPPTVERRTYVKYRRKRSVLELHWRFVDDVLKRKVQRFAKRRMSVPTYEYEAEAHDAADSMVRFNPNGVPVRKAV